MRVVTGAAVYSEHQANTVPAFEGTKVIPAQHQPIRAEFVDWHAFACGELDDLSVDLDRMRSPGYIEAITDVARAFLATLRADGRIFFCGNGGSAACAQHLSAELVGRQNHERPPIASVALSVDTSALTAIGNDYGYESVFARQVEALGRRGDVLVGLSTSGRSPNVVRALKTARDKGMVTVALTGEQSGDMGEFDLVVAVPSRRPAHIQELHIAVGHIVCAIVERALFVR